jgi:hypothetical protein
MTPALLVEDVALGGDEQLVLNASIKAFLLTRFAGRIGRGALPPSPETPGEVGGGR